VISTIGVPLFWGVLKVTVYGGNLDDGVCGKADPSIGKNRVGQVCPSSSELTQPQSTRFGGCSASV